ncbi:DUF3489 domain-containing protein [Arenibacterium sp. CAU 1754]
MKSAKLNPPKTNARAKPAARQNTKKVQLIRMLTGETGTDVAAVGKKLGWQNHTTRAALTGLRKAGYVIAAEKPADGKLTRYRIMAEPKTTSPAQAGATSGAG